MCEKQTPTSAEASNTVLAYKNLFHLTIDAAISLFFTFWQYFFGYRNGKNAFLGPFNHIWFVLAEKILHRLTDMCFFTFGEYKDSVKNEHKHTTFFRFFYYWQHQWRKNACVHLIKTRKWAQTDCFDRESSWKRWNLKENAGPKRARVLCLTGLQSTI